MKRVGVDTLTTYLAGVNAGTVTSTGLSDSSGVISLDIQNMTASTTIADADLVVIDDGAGGTLRKMTRANFIESAALDAINIDGGAIDGTAIGANSAAAGTFAAIVGTNADMSGTLHADGAISGDSTLQIDGTVGIGVAALVSSFESQMYVQTTLVGADDTIIRAERGNVVSGGVVMSDNSSVQGLKVYDSIHKTSGDYTGQHTGVWATVNIGGDNTQEFTYDQIGFYADMNAGHAGNPAAGSVSGDIVGFQNQTSLAAQSSTTTGANSIDFRGIGLINGTVTDRYGVYIKDTGGTVTNQYGIYIEDMDGATDGSSTNYGIYIVGADTAGIYTEAQIRIGANAANNAFDNAANGSGSTTMYIGTHTIDVTDPSDSILKENIADTTIDSLSILDQLQLRDFNWKKDDQNFGHIREKQFGMVAQEVEEVLPHLVRQDSEGIRNVQYNKIIPYLVKAIQELKQEIQEVRNVN